MSLPQIARKDSARLEAAEAFLLESLRPKAQQMDQDLAALTQGLDGLGGRGWLGLRVPEEFGGLGFDDRAFRRFQETCSRCSGALAFLQTQHQSACGFLAKSENEDLKERTLPKLATAERTAGIAFSQLRRTGNPLLTAEPSHSGYLLSGKAPWITGWGIFDACVTAATLPSGDTIFVWHRLEESRGFKVSEPMRLASIEVAQTVSGEFVDFAVPEEDILYIRPGNWIHENDLINIALQSPFSLGCARAGIDVMRDAFAKKPIDAIALTADSLEKELECCRDEAYGAMENKGDTERSLNARAWAIHLAGRCAHAAVAASSGAGNSMQHAAQRVYREALVFTVSAQTTPIMEATLRRLASPQ
ncbi:MAG: acyl-CoA/acyl-ACP dehydrogenase [Armatimonadetes bacterium]|nr:acyl-CoA/acyl-ACP dehydrogenase [Armatimonadota bacterium]